MCESVTQSFICGWGSDVSNADAFTARVGERVISNHTSFTHGAIDVEGWCLGDLTVRLGNRDGLGCCLPVSGKAMHVRWPLPAIAIVPKGQRNNDRVCLGWTERKQLATR